MVAGAKGTARVEATSSGQSMRAFLSALAEAGDLVTIPDPVALDYDVAACLAQADDGPALQFQNIKGGAGKAAMPIVGNLLNSLPRFASGMSSSTRAMQATLIAAIEKPIPRFFEKEGGPYITAGAIVAKDKATGQTNLSIARLMPIGENRAFVGIAP